MDTDVAREAWRTMQRLMFDGEGHGRMGQACRAVGGPPSVVKALIHLAPDEPRPMRDLADHWGCDASYVTSLVDSLEEQGMAERRPHPTDRRIKTVVLTPKGAEARDRVLELMWEPPSAFAALSAEELRRLRDLLHKVAEADTVLLGARAPAG
ncbi:MAG: MarR family winged helix-turn-helix transcriptional regulator [Acidimicrobiales bacterium]|nr:MarR family winged helix-turn-helix transcriptional regulator [Actinomycetota bacterium]